MRKLHVLTLLVGLTGVSPAFADGNQVFYRFGKSTLTTSRGTQVFTDTNATAGKNDEKTGTSFGAGLDLAMYREMGPGDLLGQIAATYTKYSHKTVRQTTSALLSGTANSEVAVAELEVSISPKYRFMGILEGKLRPWISPLGLSFLVNSPPSNDSTYLDIGLPVSLGFEYVLVKELSIGLDARHTFAMKDPKVDGSHTAFDVYAGLNF